VFLLCTTIPPRVINTAAPMARINSSPELKQRAIVSPASSAWVATASPSDGEKQIRLMKQTCLPALRSKGRRLQRRLHAGGGNRVVDGNEVLAEGNLYADRSEVHQRPEPR